MRLLRVRLVAPGSSRHPGREAGPLGAQPLPRVLEPAASKAADVTAFGHLGAATLPSGALQPDELLRGRHLPLQTLAQPRLVTLHLPGVHHLGGHRCGLTLILTPTLTPTLTLTRCGMAHARPDT